MATYKIDNINGGADIINPIVEFTGLESWNMDTKIGVINCSLTTPNGSKFSVPLFGIDLPTVNEGTITAKGQLKLDELYKI